VCIEDLAIPKQDIAMNDAEDQQPEQTPEKMVCDNAAVTGRGAAHKQQDSRAKAHGANDAHGAFEEEGIDPPDIQVPAGGTPVYCRIHIGMVEAKPGDIHQQDAAQCDTADDIQSVYALSLGCGG